jgi:hypothetical protein
MKSGDPLHSERILFRRGANKEKVAHFLVHQFEAVTPKLPDTVQGLTKFYPWQEMVKFHGALKDEFEDLIGTKAPCITKRLSLVVSAQASLPPKLRNGRRTGLAVLRPFLSLPPPRRVRRGLRWPNPI